MKTVFRIGLAIALMAMLSCTAKAQSLTRLCFQTGTSVQSCQTVTAANPLPTSADPCQQATKINLPISQTATATNQIVAASGTTKVYVCSLSLVSASANTVSLVSGTGTNCGTGTTALLGSITPANSM